MNLFLSLMIFSLNGHATTSFYTFYKFGAYSINDFDLNLGLDRYDFAIGLEKRQHDFGIRALTIEIDSVLNNYRLTIGEKPAYVNGPLSTTLNLWGMTLKGRNGELFLGKTEDPTSFLPPTFSDNRYTIGCRLDRNISYRMPAEFYILRKSDFRNASGILDNNLLGTNLKLNLGKNFLFNSQASASFSDVGFGGAFALDASYTAERYGGQAYLRNIFNDYATPSNTLAQPGNWFRTYLYQKPLGWISFSQDIAYSSIYDMGLGLNTVINKAPLPEFAYGINVSSHAVGQSINSKYQYKNFSITSGYGWSKDYNNFEIRLGQAFNNYQIWTGFQASNNAIFQFGAMFPLSSIVKFKSSLNIAKQNGHTTRSTGLETSLQLPQNFYLNAAYELVNSNGAGLDGHYLSLNLSNNIIFNEIGFGFISGKVFMDLNGNGIFDIEDQTIASVEVILDNSKRVKTNEHGDYAFSFVKQGTHNIFLDLGCMPAEIGTEKGKYNTNTEFLKRTRIDFPLGELGTFEGELFYDENGNGTKEQNESGVPNVVIKINGSLTTTNGQGKYRIANLASGTYVMTVQLLPPGTMLPTQELIFIHLKPGQKFLNRPLGIIKNKRPVNKKVFGE